MEQIYALGIVCVEFVQYWFEDSEWYFEIVNNLSNPHNITDILFPLVTIIDSVFGAQLLLCVAFGGWVNCMLKWWLQEDRPYWWVRETTYYSQMERPSLQQTSQTCETGPGSPSGHSSAAATLILLMLMWLKHIMHDRKCYYFWWKYIMYPLSVFAISSVMVSRMYTASHFPHQCLVGAFIGAFLAPLLCIYVLDPYIWRYGKHFKSNIRVTLSRHVLGSIAIVIVSVIMYYGLVLTGYDPQWTVKMAFRWCEAPENIQVSSTPIFALVQATASLLGLALSVTPAIAEYRHYTKNRSLIISAISTVFIMYSYKQILNNICTSNTLRYYLIVFMAAALKPMLLLRITPAIAMWPFSKSKYKSN